MTTIITRIRGSITRILKARDEGVLTLTDPLDLWILEPGDTVIEANGNQGTVCPRQGGAHYVDFGDHSVYTLSGLDFPLTVIPAN